MNKLQSKYLLLNSIALIKDQNGRYLCDPFWAKDLKLHLDYIADLHLCCPVIEAGPSDDIDALAKKVSYNFGGMTDITDYPIKINPLLYSKGWSGVIKGFLPNFFRINRAITNKSIVHTDGAGWPFPLSFYVLPIKWFKSFKWVMIIESTFWMIKKGESANLRQRFTHYCHQYLLPLCTKYADVKIFTHTLYRDMFNRGEGQVHIAPYSSLDSEFLISPEQLSQRNSALFDRKLRLFFAARLIKEKGIDVLLDAITLLSQRKIPVVLDLVGSGELEQQCRDFAEKDYGSVEMNFLETVPYGKPFFDLMAKYDALLITNLTEEQPRIVFDAFAQGMPVIASDTKGLKTVCKHNENALIFKTGDAEALADAIELAVSDKELINKLGKHCLEIAKSMTHQQMHKNRADFFNETVLQPS